MKKFSNTYIFIYSTVLVAVVAILLAVVSLSLKERQKANQTTEMRQMILSTINEGVKPAASEADAMYTEKIQEVQLNETEKYYVYDNGVIFRFDGLGLWGKIWGYVAFDKEFNVVGAIFDHQGETPGLGAEIATEWFSEQFKGKSIIENGELHPIQLVKKSNRDQSSKYEVDAITGGTMTSNGMNDMLVDCIMNKYADVINQMRGNVPAAVEEMAEADAENTESTEPCLNEE